LPCPASPSFTFGARIPGFLALLLSAGLLWSGELAGQEEERERFLIIHLDGVSSQVFVDELEAGRLENLRRAFPDDQIIPYGVTFYPPFTSAVVTRLRHGIAADDGRVVDWEEYDPESREHLGPTGVFLSYAATVPRRARSTFLYGLPYMDPVAGLSLWNLPELVDTYGTLEFYWFGTDTAGHLWGEDALRRSLRRFDRHVPRALNRLDDEVNILIYADHGMVFGQAKAYDDQVEEALDSRVEHYAYPNIYLRDGEDPEEVAHDLLERSWLDLVFFRDGPDLAVGLHRGGRIELTRDGSRIRYAHDGSDPFGYDLSGYEGEFLSPDEWLDLTFDHNFPYAPVRVLELLDNPHSGELIAVLNEPRVKTGPWSLRGNHHGLTASDMTVPVLVRGPALEHLNGRRHARLEDLLAHVDPELVHPNPPHRELHSVHGWFPLDSDGGGALELSVSPRYRMRAGADLDREHGDHAWATFDVASGILSRTWVGGGITSHPRTRPVLLLDHHIRVARFGLNARLAHGRPNRLDLVYRPFESSMEVRLRNFRMVGLGFRL
jgi:hypothetical protein